MSKRKAWDDAIKQAAEEAGTKLHSGARKDRKKRETRRRVNARRWIATSDQDDLQRKVEARLEALEEANYEDEFEEEDEEEWCDEEQPTGRGRKAKAKAAKKLKRSGSGGGGGGGGGSGVDLNKRYRPRPLAHVLLEEHAARSDPRELIGFVAAEAAPSKVPGRRLCAITGMVAKYRDPNSNLGFASSSASAQLKDTPPPWLHSTGNAPYFDAVRLIKKEVAEAEPPTW